MGLLSTYTGPWTRREAAHLLRRTCFGALPAQVQQAVSAGLTSTIGTLFSPHPQPDPPVDPDTGVTYVTGEYDPLKNNGAYNRYTKAWWAGLMLTDTISIREKLTLFWSNHFATEMQVVSNARQSYFLLAYLRENGLKSFKDMTRYVTTDAAMLRYLNGDTNTKGSPNENYARELQELFTIGKGPEAAPGDYTYYTEQDVQAAAKVLTGWRPNRQTGIVTFSPQQHDTTNKQFSARYQNKVIQGRTGPNAGIDELNELLDMIFSQSQVSRFIVRKLYRWFVHSEITEAVETEVIEPLASTLRQNGFMIEPVLRTLLSSEQMFSAEVIGGQLRSPADFTIGLIRSLQTITYPTEAMARYNFFNPVQGALQQQQMDLGEPPNVAGWAAYYQEPEFYRIWLTTVTLPLRNGYTDTLITGSRQGRNGAFSTVDYVLTISGAEDAYKMVDEINATFFALPFSEDQKARLVKEVLQGGTVPDYEWTTQWQAFKSNPSNQGNRNALKTKLDAFFKYLFRLAEFQLF